MPQVKVVRIGCFLDHDLHHSESPQSINCASAFVDLLHRVTNTVLIANGRGALALSANRWSRAAYPVVVVPLLSFDI